MNGANNGFYRELTELEKMEKKLQKQKDIVDDISKSAASIGDALLNGLKKGFDIVKKISEKLIEPLDALVGMGEELAGIEFSNFTSFENQIKLISTQMKALIADQINWQQELIRTYKDIAQNAQGSKELLNIFKQTGKTISSNLMVWRELGGEAEGMKLATGLAAETINNIGNLSEDVLLKWHKQNIALGITQETSTKIMAMQLRAGMTIEKSLKFQREVYAVLRNQFKQGALTSKIMEKIASSQWAIMLYSKGSVKETARIAAHAHAWKVEIDEIYSMSQAMAESEKAIETSRKAQLMFGINLNARQMQYMAQMGQETDLAEMLVDTFRENIGQFDELSLSQRKFIADTIAGGDVLKARTMLLGRGTELSEQANDLAKEAQDPAKAQLEVTKQTNKLMKDNTEILASSIDKLANYNTQLTMIRNQLWDKWSGKLKFIFGEQLSMQEASLRMEETKVNFMAQALEPMLNRLNEKMSTQYGIHKLIGNSITDESSLLGRMYNDVFKPIQDVVTEIGFGILDWWMSGTSGAISGAETFRTIIENVKSHASEIVGVFTEIGDWVLGIGNNLAQHPEIITQIIDNVKTAIATFMSFVKHVKFMLGLWATLKMSIFGVNTLLKIHGMLMARNAVQAAAERTAEAAGLTTKAASSAAGIPYIGWWIAAAIVASGIISAVGTNMLIGDAADSISNASSKAAGGDAQIPSALSPTKQAERKMPSEDATARAAAATTITPDIDYEPPQTDLEPTKIDGDDQVKLATLIAQKIKEELFVDMTQVKSIRNVIPVYTRS